MMVVPDPIFVKRCRTSRLNAPEEAPLDKHPESVIYRLARDGTNISTNVPGDSLSRCVWSIPNRTNHGYALGRNGDAVLAERTRWIDHVLD